MSEAGRDQDSDALDGVEREALVKALVKYFRDKEKEEERKRRLREGTRKG